MMKKLYRIAAIVLALGLVLSFCGVAAAGFDFEKLGTQLEYEQRTFSAQPQGVSALSISVTNEPVRIIPSQDGQIHITYWETEFDHYNVTQEGGLISCNYWDSRAWYDHIMVLNFSFTPHEVTVALPEGVTLKASVRNVNGPVEAEGVTLNTLSASTVNGRISLRDVQAQGEISLVNTNGGIDGSAVRAGAFTATTQNGPVDLAGLESGEGAAARSVNGPVSLVDCRVGGLTAESMNGRIDLSRVRAQGNVSLTTVNGPIGGTLIGEQAEYAVSTSTVNGGSSLPNSVGGEWELMARSTNGGIDLRFVER